MLCPPDRLSRAGLVSVALNLAVLSAACTPTDSTAPEAPEPAPADSALTFAVATPISFTRARAAHAAEIGKALDDIRLAIPQATLLGYFVEVGTTPADWTALLDLAHARGFRALIAFAERKGESGHQGFRPEYVNGQWQLGSLGELMRCRACMTHPALYAVGTLDEPWHHEKRPFYTSAQLIDLDRALKAEAPTGTAVRTLIGFSRELWRQLHEGRNPEMYWDARLSDITMISGLEFQDHTYQFDLLDQNHTWSRRLIHEKKPDQPLWTTVQVFGGRYGPGAGYWFPRERDGHADLTRLLNDLTAAKYESEHRLSVLMFQNWDSPNHETRAHQFTLGDRYLAGQPADQVRASEEALQAIQRWASTHR